MATYPAEHAALEGSLQELNAEAAEFEALEDRTQFLRNQLRQSVEILEEDHGKAIFVFTMVTTIFLPLYYPHLCWLADMAQH
jgi:Mg2+ and Co2+ transporter CorA